MKLLSLYVNFQNFSIIGLTQNEICNNLMLKYEIVEKRLPTFFHKEGKNNEICFIEKKHTSFYCIIWKENTYKRQDV